MFGPFNDPRVAVGIGGVFGEASRRVEERRRRSMRRRERQGTSDRREESDTDDLIDDFETAINAGIGDVHGQFVSDGVRMDVEFHPTNVAGEERRYGADFGVRLHIEGPNYNISKGVLFQCKRMYGPEAAPTFDELRGRGEEQARKMLSVTPASFFLLFNGAPAETVARWIKPPAGLYPFYREFGPFPFPWREFWRYIELRDPPLPRWNTGVMVLPASRVYAESRVCRQQGSLLPLDAEHWIAGSLLLGVFMADAFGSCFVGGVRASVLRIVTPPTLRDLALDGVADFEPSMLPVKSLMNMIVRGDQG